MIPHPTRWRPLMIALGFVVLGGYSIWSGQNFSRELRDQQECTSAFIASQSGTTQIRSDANEMESHATRQIIEAVLTARAKDGSTGITPATRAAITRAYLNWTRQLAIVDQERAQNPPKVFDDKSCKGGS